MCAACVAQGITYVGGAVGGLRVMAARAQYKRRANDKHSLAERTAEHVVDDATVSAAPH